MSPGAGCLGHFIREFDDYTAAVVTEARIRNQRRHTGFQDYLRLRLYTIGSMATYALCEYGLDLPDEVLSHPRMTVFREQTSYLTAITNVGCP